MQAYEDVARSLGFERLQSFAIPFLKGPEKFLRRKLKALYASVRDRPTVLRYSDDPATVRFLKVTFPSMPDENYREAMAIARELEARPGTFDRSTIVFLMPMPQKWKVSIVVLNKNDPKGPSALEHMAKQRGQQTAPMTCVVCLETKSVTVYCKRCTATMCLWCTAKNEAVLGGKCPLCRAENGMTDE